MNQAQFSGVKVAGDPTMGQPNQYSVKELFGPFTPFVVAGQGGMETDDGGQAGDSGD
jgi:hypothetical protein